MPEFEPGAHVTIGDGPTAHVVAYTAHVGRIHQTTVIVVARCQVEVDQPTAAADGTRVCLNCKKAA